MNNNFRINGSGSAKWDSSEESSEKSSKRKSSHDRLEEVHNPVKNPSPEPAPTSLQGRIKIGDVKTPGEYSEIDKKVGRVIKPSLKHTAAHGLTENINLKRGELDQLASVPKSKQKKAEEKRLKSEIRGDLKSLKKVDKSSYKEVKSGKPKMIMPRHNESVEPPVRTWPEKVALAKGFPTLPEKMIEQSKAQLAKHRVGSRKFYPGTVDDFYPTVYDSSIRSGSIVKNMKTATESLFALSPGKFYTGDLTRGVVIDVQKLLSDKFFEYLTSISEEDLPSVLTDIVVAYGREPILFIGEVEPFLVAFTNLFDENDQKSEIQAKINLAVNSPAFMQGFSEEQKTIARQLLT